ncbi:MAG: hypothetical protein CL609_08185 [Anaerolineaceae bacterium]|jgi:HD superfamily phosphodiesterase|nr:hypothetical protein [Anaerolineaceae bacterium]
MHNPEWLLRLRNELSKISGEVAVQIWPSTNGKPYFNYRLEHVRQVERDARWLLNLVGGDEDVVLAAVWLHDRFQPQLESPEDHAGLAAGWAAGYLPEIGFPEEKINQVVYAVEMHSSPVQSLPEDAHEARLLWDADKLTKLGPLSVVNMIAVMPAYPDHSMNSGEIVRMAKQELSRRQTLVDYFYFEQSRERARQRVKVQEDFIRQMSRDVAGV